MIEKVSMEQLDEVNGGAVYKISGQGDSLNISFSPFIKTGDVAKLNQLLEKGNSKEQVFSALHNAQEKARLSGSYPMYEHIGKTASAFGGSEWKEFCDNNGYKS